MDDLPDRRRPVHFPPVERHNRSVLTFVTVCTKDRRPCLANDEVHALILDAWADADRFQVGRYVIMPDHVHFFCAPNVWPPQPLGTWVAFWKSAVARRWPGARGAKLWQRDFWDTQLRQGESYSAKWDYVRQNPVRADLVKRAEDWPFQGEVHSLRWHEG